MIFLKCKMCGGNLDVQEGSTVCECGFCGTKQTIPTVDDEKKIAMFARADHLRSTCEFDKASMVYENIVADFPKEAEAYWGLILCKYGIEYVDDPDSGNKVMTCHRSSFDCVLDEDDFNHVMECSDVIARRIYKEEAKKIEKLRLTIANDSLKADPYDVFICYKERDEYGKQTIDSTIAQEVYDLLTRKKYRVFFSRISLEDKVGETYEPYIFSALNSSKVMIVFGTDYEYFNAVWVKNEWMRFLRLIEKGEKKFLLPCYKNIDVYDMPREFLKFQALDMGRVGAVQELLCNIDKIFGRVDTIADKKNNETGMMSALVQRGNMAIEDGEYKAANKFFDRALDENPLDGYAYIGKFLAYMKIKNLSELSNQIVKYEKSKVFCRARQFADENLSKVIEEAICVNQRNIEEKNQRLEEEEKKGQSNFKMYEAAKKQAFSLIFLDNNSGIDKAIECFKDLEDKGIKVHDEYSVSELLGAAKCFGRVLSDRHMHAEQSLLSAASNTKIHPLKLLAVIKDMVRLGVVEEFQSAKLKQRIYGFVGVKAERDRILEKEEIERKKNNRIEKKFRKACDEVEQKIQEELQPILSMIRAEYDPQIAKLRTEMRQLFAAENQERVSIQLELLSLQGREKIIGSFDTERKTILQNQILMVQNKLNLIMTPDQMTARYQPQIDALIGKKQSESMKRENEVRSKYIMPKREDFEDG